MAGVVALPFRILCNELGCSLVYTEMICAKGVVHGNANNLESLKFKQQEKSVVV